MATDEVPAVDDAAAADRALRAARAGTTVVIASNLLVPGREAEVEAGIMANSGLRADIIGYRPALPHEQAPGWRGAWDGDTSKITLGRPPWWSQRTPVGVGSHQALLDDQWAGYNLTQAAAEARPAS